MSVRIATRPSPLAKIQANKVGHLLGVDFQLVEVSTSGDVDQSSPISKIAGNGVFVKEIQRAVLENKADLAVHSAKDLPSCDTTGLVIGAFPEREDPRDVLVGSTLDQLGFGAELATGSQRRRAQIAKLRPDLVFVDIRGNIATRIEKAVCVVVAACALKRLEMTERICEYFELDRMVPQVGQGALAVECRQDDFQSLALLSSIDNAQVRRCVESERAFLGYFGGGCDLPIGAYATLEGDEISLTSVFEAQGELIRKSICGKDPYRLGRELAEKYQ